MLDAKEQAFLIRLRATFRLEAEEHLRTLSAGLIDLEKGPTPARCAEIVEVIFREAHSLKGAAHSVNLRDVEAICQPLESTLAALKLQALPHSAPLFDLLHRAVDSLTALVAVPDGECMAVDRLRQRDLTRQLAEASLGVVPLETPALPPTIAIDLPSSSLRETGWRPAQQPDPAQAESGPKPEADTQPPVSLDAPPRFAPEMPAVETVRIPITKLDPLLLQAEEMIQAKLAGAQRVADLRGVQLSLLAWKTEATQRKDQRAWQSLEAQAWLAAHLETLSAQLRAVSQALEQDQRALRHMVDVHLDAMKQVLMLPVSTLVAVFPRLVRDLARDQGKDVDLLVSGGEIEIDKRILEELKDPLIHLVRNCVDHGLEQPSVRARAQKPARGTITLAFSAKDGRQIEILVTDDGAGVDAYQVRAAAIKAGLLSAQAADRQGLSEMLPIIFQSGLTTSAILTNLSGRGLGLAIVREKVEKLGGTVTVESRAGQGTTFRLQLPLTLATFRGVLVRARDQMFVVPTAQVERAVRVSQDEIQTIENRETIRLGDQVLALIQLADILALPVRPGARPAGLAPSALAGHVQVLILASGERRLAVQVDEVVAEEEVLVKSLGKQLVRVRNLAGATVLGAGTVVPVLNVLDLLNSAVRAGGTLGAPAVLAQSKARVGRILVADDSITSRTLLKNTLETSGHDVASAVDGADALTQLRSREFDLLVSDVDMPALSGFELTARIRADPNLNDLPVVLVTSLEARADRERGIEVGANAYLVKSSFDPNNLLEVIARLLCAPYGRVRHDPRDDR